MELVTVSQVNQVMPTIPAGTTIRDLTPPALFGAVLLSTGEAASDILTFVGVPPQPTTVTIPTPTNPNMVIGTTPAPAQAIGTPNLQLAPSWTKIIQNLCTGPNAAFSLVGPGGGLIAVPPGKSQLVFSPDGLVVFPANQPA